MTDLITEARELCESATPGPWEVKLHNEDYGQGYGETTFFVDTDGTLLKIGIADAAEKYAKYNALSAFIARSRTLIPELCDALEKAEEQNKQLMHEVCKLACESVEREKTLARLEAEVVARLDERLVRCGECRYRQKAKVNRKGFLICPASGMEITDDDFCSYGERKEPPKGE